MPVQGPGHRAPKEAHPQLGAVLPRIIVIGPTVGGAV